MSYIRRRERFAAPPNPCEGFGNVRRPRREGFGGNCYKSPGQEGCDGCSWMPGTESNIPCDPSCGSCCTKSNTYCSTSCPDPPFAGEICVPLSSALVPISSEGFGNVRRPRRRFRKVKK